MRLDVFLSIIAAAMHVAAFLLYNKQMLKGESQPNTATFTLWAFLTVLNFTSYLKMSDDLVKSLLPIASSIACLATFAFALTKGHFSRLSPYDNIALAIGVIASSAWWYYKSAMHGNLILQLAILVSFLPTYRGVWRVPTKEKAPPWLIWSAAYVLSLGVVYLRWRGQWQDLVYPANCLVLHLIVVPLTWRKAMPTEECQTTSV